MEIFQVSKEPGIWKIKSREEKLGGSKARQSLLGWKNTGPPTQLFYEGRIVTRPAGLASSMNRFFVDKVRGLRNNIPVVASDPLQKLKEAMKTRKCKFTLKPVTVTGVLNLIKGLKPSYSPGTDYIDSSTKKQGADLLAPPIS